MDIKCFKGFDFSEEALHGAVDTMFYLYPNKLVDCESIQQTAIKDTSLFRKSYQFEIQNITDSAYKKSLQWAYYKVNVIPSRVGPPRYSYRLKSDDGRYLFTFRIYNCSYENNYEYKGKMYYNCGFCLKLVHDYNEGKTKDFNELTLKEEKQLSALFENDVLSKVREILEGNNKPRLVKFYFLFILPLILPVNNTKPAMGENCFVAENATIVGDVVLGNDCSVWFNAVIRGDVNSIRIGNKTNIQDGAVIHCTYQKAATEIGNNVSIGHNAIVHGCTIHDNVLIGMGAIVMDKAVVGEGCIIAAGAIVLENTQCEPGYLYAGIPARKIKPVTEEQTANMAKTADNYVLYSSWFK